MLWFLSRDNAPHESAAMPEAAGAPLRDEPAPVVEPPEVVELIEPAVASTIAPHAEAPTPSRPAPSKLEPRAAEVVERLPEGWTPPLEEFGSVSVTVTSSPERSPLEGVRVWLETDGEIGLFEMPEPRYSDADGRVSFERVSAGLVRVWTRPSGSNPIVRVAHGEHSTADVRVQRLRSVEGVVRTLDGEPAPGAEIWDVQLHAAHDVPRPLTRADESGEFRLWLSQGGDTYLCARGGDALPSNIARVAPNARGTTEHVEFVLGPKGQRLEVLVTGPKREPIADASVSLQVTYELSPDLPQWSVFDGFGNSNALWRSRSDLMGVATFEGLPRGALWLRASAHGHIADLVVIRLPHPESSPPTSFAPSEVVTVTNERLELALLRGVTLEGRVRMPDGRPAARAAVRHGHENRPGSVTTRADEHGYFRLHDVPTNACTVYSRLGDFAAEEKLPAVAPDTTRWWAPVLRYDPR
jgi:hypothetical protein